MEDKVLGLDDIVLVPQYSTLRSRSEADTGVKVWKYDLKAPLVSANMKTVTGTKLAVALWNAGGLGALHRFWSIYDNVAAYRNVRFAGADCIVSVGVNAECRQRAKDLYDEGARMFVVDIAHGDSIVMEETMKWMRDKFGDDLYLVAGNVATAEATNRLCDWGANAVKVGIGSGSICSTRIVTGHGMPMATAVMECASITQDAGNVLLIADGGIRNSGDVVKALALGADLVMAGRLFAQATESLAPVLSDGKKQYVGSAASPGKQGVASEGVVGEVECGPSTAAVVGELVGGLRSGMSYSNSRTLDELRARAQWKIQTASSYIEGTPHILAKK